MATDTLVVKLLFGQGTSDKDTDIYVKIKMGTHPSVQSKLVEKCRSPVFNETFTFSGVTPSDDRLEIKVFRVKGLILSREEMLGTATVSLAEVRAAGKQQATATVNGEKGKQHGTITLDLEWRPVAPAALPEPDKGSAGSAYAQHGQASAPPPFPVAAPGYPVEASASPAPPAQQVVVMQAPAAAPAPQVTYVVQQQPQQAPPPNVVFTTTAAAAAPPPAPQAAAPAGYPAPAPYTVPAPYPGAPPPPAGMGQPYGYAPPPPTAGAATATTVVVNEAPQRRGPSAGAALAAGMVMGAGMQRRQIRRMLR